MVQAGETWDGGKADRVKTYFGDPPWCQVSSSGTAPGAEVTLAGRAQPSSHLSPRVPPLQGLRGDAQSAASAPPPPQRPQRPRSPPLPPWPPQPSRPASSQSASHLRPLSSAGLPRPLSGPEVGRGRCQTGGKVRRRTQLSSHPYKKLSRYLLERNVIRN
ncbi:wiskott-Aldrich syndrome protein homolog [Ailuropoda melanoleuca]|uniref:wiskott-Aldrich syndrome protein homolog n=1 Tax=Ailuropoda melanoleuca TaxID=9646 RepID=UPI001494E502|nr:wiskott-Aldrich syndrome protein homolog [Ailuropoda melanoleuca]